MRLAPLDETPTLAGGLWGVALFCRTSCRTEGLRRIENLRDHFTADQSIKRRSRPIEPNRQPPDMFESAYFVWRKSTRTWRDCRKCIQVRLFQMKTSIFGWETKFGFVYIITLLPSHKRHNPSIYAKHFNAPGTNSSRPICKRFLTKHPKRHRMQPWNTSASISMSGNGPNLFLCHQIRASRIQTFVSASAVSANVFWAISVGWISFSNTIIRLLLSYGYRKAYACSYFPDSLTPSSPHHSLEKQIERDLNQSRVETTW